MPLCIRCVSREIGRQVFDLGKLVLWREARFDTLANAER